MKNRIGMLVAWLLAAVLLLTACTGTDTSESLSESESGRASESLTETSTESGSETESVSFTETDTESETASETDTETASETDTESESVTESETGSEAPERWGELSEEEKDAKMAELDAAMPDRVQEFYGYGCPASPDIYEQCIEVFREAGLTGIVSGEQFLTSSTNLFALCDACEEAEFNLIIDMWLSAKGEDERAAYAESCVTRLFRIIKDFDCVRGVYLRDEPSMAFFPTIGAVRDEIVKRLDEDSDFVYFANIYPALYANGIPGLKNQYAADGISWLDGAKNYMEVVRPSAMLFDRYPWSVAKRSSQNSPELYVANLLEGRKAADPTGTPQWAYLQFTSLEGEPTVMQMVLSAHLSLACNVENFILFTAYDVVCYPGFVSKDGTANHRLPRVRALTGTINGMRCVYQDFDMQKVMTPGNRVYEKAILYYDTEEYLVESYGVVGSVTTDAPIFVGCGVDDAGRYGYYVINTGYATTDPDASPVLVLTEECNYQIWGTEGLENIGSGQEIRLELSPAEAYFVIVEPIR